MPDDYIDPVDGVTPSHPVEAGGRRSGSGPVQAARLNGRVIAVHKKSGHHEGGHVLDTSVGAQEYAEVVIRVDSGDLEDLVGKDVVINYRP